MELPISEGLLVVVKRDCETCHLVLPVLEELAAGPGLTVASQDDPSFPTGLPIIDDTDLDLSWELGTETTPTLYRIQEGSVVDQTPGWDRTRWEEVAGVAGLAPGLPDQRPGCGSRVFEPDVYEALVRRHTGSTLSSRHVVLAESEDEIEGLFQRGWSDGLPLVPPTIERVERMLAGADRDASDVVCVMPPNLVDCTVEKVAINAVMAGCLPAYLPVVLAAVEAVATDRFNMHGLAATTYFAGPVVVVSGPIRHAIGMNGGLNAFGPGNRANLTIGRALSLVVRNVGGAIPGGVDRATLGSPGKLSFCFAEDEEGSPWVPLGVERGVPAGRSAVTVFAGHGPVEIVDQLSRTPESLAASMALALDGVGHRKLAGAFDAMLVVSPEHARVFANAGWDKARLRAALAERLTIPADRILRGVDGIAEGMPPSWRGRRVAKLDATALPIVHAGGTAGLFSAIISGWVSGPRGSQITTVEVRS